MSAHKAVAVLLLAVTAGCGTTKAPRGWLPRAAHVQSEAFGGWAIVEYRLEEEAALVAEGELIAVSADTVWLLGDTVSLAIPAAQVRHARVTGYHAQPSAVRAAAAGGVVATVSNGWFLIFTAPAWALTGIFASRAQARHPVRTAEGSNLSALAEFARFPQGLPPGLVLNTLRPRKPMSR